jgi:hypothetical protein
MKKATTGARDLEERLHCLGQFDPHDSICVKWCLFSIRCAIARHKNEELETMDHLVDLAVEPYGLQ